MAYISLCSAVLLVWVTSTVAYRRQSGKADNVFSSSEPTDCLSLANFPGQCMVSTAPGACYIKDGVMDADNKTVKWACWGDEELTDEQCQSKERSDGKPAGYEGACVYKGHGVELKDADIRNCKELDFYHHQCNPTTERWGACYIQGAEADGEGWMCIDKGSDPIANLRKGDCTTIPSGPPGKPAYSDVCVFPETPLTVFQCETVPRSHTCSRSDEEGEVKSFGACWTLVENVEWSCFNETEIDKVEFKNCDTTPLPLPGTPTASYEGACLFEGSPGYDDAAAWKKPEEPKTPAPTPAPEQKPDATPKPTAEPTKPKSSAPPSMQSFVVIALASIVIIQIV